MLFMDQSIETERTLKPRLSIGDPSNPTTAYMAKTATRPCQALPVHPLSTHQDGIAEVKNYSRGALTIIYPLYAVHAFTHRCSG